MIGRQIIVRETANWYNGRQAVITAAEVFGDITVYTVACANVTFALRSDKVEFV